MGQTDCKYSYELNGKEEDFILKCQCADTYSDTLFCPMGSSNYLFESYIAQLRTYYSERVSAKHTTKRNDLEYELRVLDFKTVQYPKIRDADDCYTKFVASGTMIKFLYFAVALYFFIIFIN